MPRARSYGSPTKATRPHFNAQCTILENCRLPDQAALTLTVAARRLGPSHAELPKQTRERSSGATDFIQVCVCLRFVDTVVLLLLLLQEIPKSYSSRIWSMSECRLGVTLLGSRTARGLGLG